MYRGIEVKTWKHTLTHRPLVVSLISLKLLDFSHTHIHTHTQRSSRPCLACVLHIVKPTWDILLTWGSLYFHIELEYLMTFGFCFTPLWLFCLTEPTVKGYCIFTNDFQHWLQLWTLVFFVFFHPISWMHIHFIPFCYSGLAEKLSQTRGGYYIRTLEKGRSVLLVLFPT